MTRRAAGGRAALRWAAAGLALTLVGLSAPRAQAYCRTSSCEEGVGARCVPAQANDCGVELFWPTSCVGYTLQKDASGEVDLATARALAAQAFAAWSQASCEQGGSPSVSAIELGDVGCDRVEYNQDGENANIIMFRDVVWPHDSRALALTTVTYALDTGKIRDADMELNTATATFTTGDEGVVVDTLSILTHEAGHFLGLSHAPTPEATMFRDYPPTSTGIRTLEPDDAAGICAVYPPGQGQACDPAPRNGLGEECSSGGGEGGGGADGDDEADGEGCAARPRSQGGGGAAALVVAALCAALRARARAGARPRS